MKKSLVSLAFGGLGLGMTEFAMMGVLPDIAGDLHVTIPQAGHFISAYALGVCVGAPLLILLARNLPPKRTLLALMAMFTLFNTLSALSPGYGMMLAMRFLAGLPHGAYFGVGAIVAGRLADEGKAAEAVSIMFAGLTVANVVGVPLGTYVGNLFSWRYTFLMVGAWGVVTLWFLRRWLPVVEAQPRSGVRSQFRFLKLPSSWVLMGVTMLGNSALFSWYSYIMPTMRSVAGFGANSEMLIMMVGGAGMVIGNLLGGRLSDRLTPQRTERLLLILLTGSLAGSFALTHVQAAALCLTLTGAALGLSLSAPMQVLVIRNADAGGQMLAAASCQVSFNLGNAIGAYCGGLPVAAGMDYTWPAAVGVGFSVAAYLLMLCFRAPYPADRYACGASSK